MWLRVIILSVFGFSSSLTKSFDLRGVIHGDRMAGVPLGISLGAGEVDVEGVCTESGIACQNCTLAVRCVPLPAGWLKVPLEECVEGFTCNAHLGRCAMETVPECDFITQKYKHTCEQVGIFPDPHDCRKFHLCSPPEGMPDGRPADHREALCPRHYGYNPQTAQCSVPLQNGQCQEKPVPPCTRVGQYGVLPASSNHYYVCLSKGVDLYPQIFMCPHGWYFWGGFCQPEPEKPPKGQSSSSEENNVIERQITTTVEPTTYKPTTSRIESFFSTEKATTYAADMFLADKFDLSNYETMDDETQTNNDDDFLHSFENNDFW